MSKSLVPVWDLPESTSSAGFFLGGIYLFVQKKFRVEKLLNVAVWLARNLTPGKTRCLKQAGERGMKKRGEGKSSVGVKNRWSGKSRVDLRKFWKLGLAMGATLRPGNRELRLAEPLTSASAIADFSPRDSNTTSPGPTIWLTKNPGNFNPKLLRLNAVHQSTRLLHSAYAQSTVSHQ